MISASNEWKEVTCKEALKVVDTHLILWRPTGKISNTPDNDAALVVSTRDTK